MMNNKCLTGSINGRKFLPVRAIPHVTKWIRFYPDKLAVYFARGECASPIARGRLLIDAYHLSGNAIVQVMPSEWDAVMASIDGFEAETWKQYGRDELGEKIGYAAWLSGSVGKLPEGVFVWLDEFERVFQADVKCTGSYVKPGDDKLTLAPMLDAATRTMVMEGFDVPPVTVKQAVPKTGGRPKSIAKKAAMVRQIIELFEETAAIKFEPNNLPGSAADLLDACQRMEKEKTGKHLVFGTSKTALDSFNACLKAAGYGFSPGRTLDAEKKYWAQLLVKTMGLITPDVFTGVCSQNSP